MERIKKENMARAIAHYVGTLAGYGLMSPDVAGSVTWAAPYGQVMYVISRPESHLPKHDVPGFEGSGGSGFVTLREGYDRVTQSARAIGDALRGRSFDSDVYRQVRDAVEGRHGIATKAGK